MWSPSVDFAAGLLGLKKTQNYGRRTSVYDLQSLKLTLELGYMASVVAKTAEVVSLKLLITKIF